MGVWEEEAYEAESTRVSPAGCRVPGWWCREEGSPINAALSAFRGSHLQQRSRGTARRRSERKKRGRGSDFVPPFFIFEEGV